MSTSDAEKPTKPAKPTPAPEPTPTPTPEPEPGAFVVTSEVVSPAPTPEPAPATAADRSEARKEYDRLSRLQPDKPGFDGRRWWELAHVLNGQPVPDKT
jgi:hypothetical protein